MSRKIPLTIRLDVSDFENLKSISKKIGRTKTSIIEECFRHYIYNETQEKIEEQSQKIDENFQMLSKKIDDLGASLFGVKKT